MTANLIHTPAHTIDVPDTFTNPLTGAAYEVRQDTDAESPLSWVESAHAGLWVFNEPRMSAGNTRELPSDNVALLAFAHFYDRYGMPDTALRMTRRYLELFPPRIPMTIAEATVRGYSQGDWLEVVAATEQGYGTPEDLIETYRQWAFGDVWAVTGPDGDSLSGIYADDPEAAVVTYCQEME